MEANGGINHELPPPLDSEFLETAWGIPRSGEKHEPMWIARPKVTDFAVKFEMLYCGICHSDVHTGKNDWGPCNFPFVGGHELLGRVVEIGSQVNMHLLFLQVLIICPCFNFRPSKNNSQ